MIRCGVELNTLEVDVGRVSNDVVLIFDDENESIFGFRPRNQIDFIPDLYVDFSGWVGVYKLRFPHDLLTTKNDNQGLV